MTMQVIAKQDNPKGELLGYHVYWGLGEMRQTGPLYTDYDEATRAASYIRSNTEVRPVYASTTTEAMVKITLNVDIIENSIADIEYALGFNKHMPSPHVDRLSHAKRSLEAELAKPRQAPCKGPNCGSTDGRLHSAACFDAQDAQSNPKPTTTMMRKEWRDAGGSVHGPNVETVTMPEEAYFKFRWKLHST